MTTRNERLREYIAHCITHNTALEIVDDIESLLAELAECKEVIAQLKRYNATLRQRPEQGGGF